MSNRDSLGFGDLLPQDVVQIFAQEKHSKRGHKKRSHSLGRALGWLKGKKRKGLGPNGRNLGLGPALDLALVGHPSAQHGGDKGGQRSGRHTHPHGNSHAVPKRDDDDKTPAPPLLQENVFIEASRPKYLEDLHTEALEGLKMMQHEETNYGVEYQDNESTISTMTVQTDGEGGGFMTDSTIADTSSVVSVQSSVSTRSSRSGLTRQGSTFRPLNSGKKSEKTRRRRHRKTVAGIPQHVQREMGLDRVGWTLAQKLDEEPLYNGETDDSPTTDGPQQTAESQKGARAGLQDKKIIHPLNKDQIKRLNATHAGHRDDLALLHHLGPNLSDGQRPRSLAVPWMTTANSLHSEPPSPVMSMSPQAPYMSKIIPNAVLPPSIEVVEISRGRSRNSLRTVSKSSLLLSSPAPSRASSRASSSRTTSSRSSTITSASRQNPVNLSDSSCWSNSESSETLVSDSSTISSSSTPRQKSRDGDASAKEDKVSKTFKYNYNGVLIGKAEAAKKEGPFVRSLSVMKSKKAPPPPSRSYSLHSKMKRRSRDLAEVRVIPGESSLHRISTTVEENEKNNSGPSPMSPRIIDSPGYNADTSSLDDSTGSFSPIRSQALKADEAVKFDSSQAKQDPPKEKKPSKIISPSSGYSSQDAISPQLSKQPHSSSPRHKRGILAKLQKLFPGSTSAGSAPSPLPQSETPENTKHNKMDSVDTVGVSASVRTLRELFNIPPPPKVHAPPPPPPEVWAHSKRSFELLLGPPAPDNIYAIIKKNPKDRRQQRQPPSASTDGSVKSLVVERKHMNPAVTVESNNGSIERRKVQESLILNAEIHKEQNERLTQNVDLKGNVKVTEKAKVSDIINVMLVKAVEKREERMKSEANEKSTETTEVKTNMDTLPAISLARISPFPSPAVLHHSPQPHTKQTTEVTSVTSVRAVVSPESSWPPPPPPITQVGVSGPDEIDFPLPPPLFGDVGFVIPVQVPPERSTPGGDSSATTSVVSVVMTEAETQKSSSSEGIAPPPLNIPPPPPYTAPPPPIKSVSPPTIKKACLPPREIFPPPPKEFSPLPQIKEVSPPSPKEVSPPPPKVVSPPPPKEVSPPPPKEVSPPPPKVVAPPPPKEVSPPPPKEVSPPPTKEVSPPPPKEVSPPPTKEDSPPPPKEVSPPPPKESSPPPSKEVSPPAPKEVSPPPPKDVSPPPPKDVSPPPRKDVSPPPPKEVSPSAPEEVSPPKQSSPLLVKHVPPPLVIKVPPSTEIPTPSTEKVVLLSSQESVSQSSVEETLVCKLNPPQSIPPPPPLQLKPHLSDIDLPQEDILPETITNQVSSSSILAPPESIPPLPPIEQPQAVAGSTTHEVPPSEVSIPQSLETSPSPEKPQEPAPSPPVNIPLPPPLPVQGLTSIKLQSSTVSTETPSQELTSSHVVQEESTPLVTPSLLQMVRLRSVNSSPEPPKAQEEPKAEVTMRKQQPSDQVPTSSVNGEAPQKPIRRSLIVTSPTSTSPPVIVTSQPALPKLQPLVAPPASSSPVPSPTKKSPPATTASPSMKLQEAIRLRTAARSKESPASRLSLQSPASPIDLQRSPKSPTSTASFIFSKSNKKVVIETKPVPEAKTKVQNKLEVSSVTKVVSEPESLKKASKVPPPVARKPKSKAKENETSEEMEQTVGQEAQGESIHDGAEKTNGTASAAEAGETPST